MSDPAERMLLSYKTVYRGGTAEITEKKSRFIAHIAPAASEEEAVRFIEEKRKMYWDARHNCFAYIIGGNPGISRAGDDGEPVAVSGSAQLIACWDEESGTNAKLVVYAAPRANLANGVAEEIELHLKKNAKNVVTGVTEVTAAPALP